MVFVPAFFVLSENDEFIEIEKFTKMFIEYNFMKKLRIIPGTHGSERDESLQNECYKFMRMNFEDEEFIQGNAAAYEMKIFELKGGDLDYFGDFGGEEEGLLAGDN